MSGERLRVTGLGSTRAKALAHAGDQAAQYFGKDAPLSAEIGEAYCQEMLSDGTPLHFAVEVVFRRVADLGSGAGR